MFYLKQYWVLIVDPFFQCLPVFLMVVLSPALKKKRISIKSKMFMGPLKIIIKIQRSKNKDDGPVKLWDKDMKKVLKVFQIEPNVDVNVVKSVCRIKV